MNRDQPTSVAYSLAADTVTILPRRWAFTTTSYPPVRADIDQMELRPVFELVPSITSGLSFDNAHAQKILTLPDGVSVTVFSTVVEHPFLVDQQYDYYPTERIAHNYVRIENDPVNTRGAVPADKEAAMVEAAQLIGSIRDGYHRKVEHIGGTPRILLVNDLLQNGAASPVTKIPLFPPKSVDPSTPDRFFLRTTDMGYKHYIRSKFSGSPFEAVETKEVTGHRTIIWDGANANFLRETDITAPEASTRIVDNAAVEVEDIEDLGNSALNAVSTALNNRFVADDKEWEIIHIPGRAAIRISSTEIILEQYKSGANKIGDRTDVLAKIQMILDGNIVITDGTRTITLDGVTVDVT